MQIGMARICPCQSKYAIEGCANGLMHKILCTEVKRNLPLSRGTKPKEGHEEIE